MIVLWGTKLSGHAHRVELLLRMLGLAYRFEDAPPSVREGAAFGLMNPLRQIPVLQDGDVTLSDSNAIMVYLVRQYDPEGPWLPKGALAEAAVQRWFSLAAGELFNGAGRARAVIQFDQDFDLQRSRRMGRRALAFMEQHLVGHDFLAAPHATLADLACYSYAVSAPEGGIALDPYPALRAWFARIEALPHFVALQAAKAA